MIHEYPLDTVKVGTMSEHTRSHHYLSTEAIAAIVFGILTLTTAIVSVRYEDTLLDFTLRICLRARRPSGT
jgi:hypothetical protein